MSVMDSALRESLKSLRLSGMLETLDARLAQAHGGELGHLDFLQVLCQDEITRRETVAFQPRLTRAKFEQQVTLEEFDFTAPQSSRPPRSAISEPFAGSTPVSRSSSSAPALSTVAVLSCSVSAVQNAHEIAVRWCQRKAASSLTW
ncbi:ATP-binding protein [Streptomyces sp. NPDC001553]|uniref:ATP-binding protein n=1 Tax=Streptomyces sp. NPDC001553 TaxID=3154385 RepID=UPI0033325675